MTSPSLHESEKQALAAAGFAIQKSNKGLWQRLWLSSTEVRLTVAPDGSRVATGARAPEVMNGLQQATPNAIPITGAYEELGRNYRFFATWRHLAFAAGIALSGAVLLMGLKSEQLHTAAFAHAAAGNAVVQLILFWLDVRTMELVQRAVDMAARHEGAGRGFFSAIAGSRRGRLISHTVAVRMFHLASAIGLLAWYFIP